MYRTAGIFRGYKINVYGFRGLGMNCKHYNRDFNIAKRRYSTKIKSAKLYTLEIYLLYGIHVASLSSDKNMLYVCMPQVDYYNNYYHHL